MGRLRRWWLRMGRLRQLEQRVQELESLVYDGLEVMLELFEAVGEEAERQEMIARIRKHRANVT